MLSPCLATIYCSPDPTPPVTLSHSPVSPTGSNVSNHVPSQSSRYCSASSSLWPRNQLEEPAQVMGSAESLVGKVYHFLLVMFKDAHYRYFLVVKFQSFLEHFFILLISSNLMILTVLGTYIYSSFR